MSANNRELIKIAYYYYKKGLTQAEIAKKMVMSRQRVNRLLKKALNENIVQINIVDVDKHHFDLETKLEEKYNLKQAIVVSSIDEKMIPVSLGEATAEYLDDILVKDDVIGVTWGRTLSEVAKKISYNQQLQLPVIQLVGGLDIAYSSLRPDDITRTIADKLGGKPYLLYAPAVVENKETKEAMLKDESFKKIIKNMENCNIILAGIGELKSDTTLYESRFNNEQYKEHLMRHQCVGDIGFRWYDIEGRAVEHGFNDRTIGYNILKNKGNALVIGIAGGHKKYEAITGALNGKYLDVLITDSEMANKLIEK
ncbi:sugar-binding transcriptional regulator [Mycoplasmatota bacterium]|nr:sugar-binding transcriptional regulator [Mycoplasmatota bacterium]